MGNCFSGSERPNDNPARKVEEKPLDCVLAGGLSVKRSRGGTAAEVLVSQSSVLGKQYFLFNRLPDPQGARVRAGATWIAREKSSAEMTVLRVLQLPLDSGLVPLVCREVEALAPALLNSHPNVMPAKAMLLSTEHLALVMAAPFTNGKLLTLEQHAGVQKKLGSRPELNMTEPNALVYFSQIMSAVEYFHSRKLAHIDIDLANMVLDCSSQPPVVRLMDRGFAKSWRVANDLTYSKKTWQSESGCRLSLQDSISDMNKSVKSVRLSNRSPNNDSSVHSGGSLAVLLGRGHSGTEGGEVVDSGAQAPSSPSCSCSSGADGSSGRRRHCEWDETLHDTVLGCSFASAQAVDIFSSGCCLFALLVGTYPQNVLQRQLSDAPWAAAEHIQQQMALGWHDYPAVQRRYALLSCECRDLLAHMLTADEGDRLSVADVRSHIWVTGTEADGAYGSQQPAMSGLVRRASSGLNLSKESAGFLGELRKKLCETAWYAANMDSGLSETECRTITLSQPYGTTLEAATTRQLGLIPETDSFSNSTHTADAAQLAKLLVHSGLGGEELLNQRSPFAQRPIAAYT